jgi:hypothetical protein
MKFISYLYKVIKDKPMLKQTSLFILIVVFFLAIVEPLIYFICGLALIWLTNPFTTLAVLGVIASIFLIRFLIRD